MTKTSKGTVLVTGGSRGIGRAVIRRMIDDGEADEDYKRLQRSRLDALLALAEAHDCRRVRLLAYFGQASPPCGNCDNCLTPPATWDGTEAARMLLSCIYRFRQHGGQRFGAGHLVDVLRGKATDKVRQHGHESLSTFGIGAALSEARWRAVLRQLIALGHVAAEGEYGTLELAPSARAVLRGEVRLQLRLPAQTPVGRGRMVRTGRATRPQASPASLSPGALALFERLKAWRAEVARAHNVPAYVVFHDASLAEMAQRRPGSLTELAELSGVGARKLQAYGEQILALLDAETASLPG